MMSQRKVGKLVFLGWIKAGEGVMLLFMKDVTTGKCEAARVPADPKKGLNRQGYPARVISMTTP
jgi:hypothetical protein